MRHRAEAAVVCRRFAKEAGPDLEALTRVLVARAVLGARVARVVRVVRVISADPVVLAVRATAVPVVPVVPVVRATSADPVVLAVLVVPATAALVVPVVPATSADPAVPVVPVTSVDPTVPTTSDRGLPTPSAVSVVPRGVMEQRRGAGENRRGPGGVGRSLLRAECGTTGRSTTGATTSNRYGIRAKMVGASTSSESGSRCNQPVG
jgi:hypothetical protein